MGAILGLLIILLMLFVLGVDTGIIIGIVLGIAALAVLFMLGFFVFSTVMLIGAKSCTAEFSRIDKSPKGHFDCAYYIVEGREYPNAFPCESVMRRHLYSQGRDEKVRLSEKHGFVFDRIAHIVCIAGLLFCIGVCTAAALIMPLFVI